MGIQAPNGIGDGASNKGDKLDLTGAAAGVTINLDYYHSSVYLTADPSVRLYVKGVEQAFGSSFGDVILGGSYVGDGRTIYFEWGWR